MLIKAEIEESKGKYYGTEIKLTNERGDAAYFTVWINELGDYTPSQAELKRYKEMLLLDGVTEEEIAADPDTYGYEVSDNHFESETTRKVCEGIVAALDGMEI